MTNRGQGIIGALISMAVLMVGLLALLSMQSNQQSAGKMSRLYTARDRLVYTMPKIAAMKGALRNSILPAALVASPVNSALASCIRGDVPGFVCSSTQYYDFQLYAPSVDAGDSESGAVAGPPGAPVFYNFNADSCRYSTCSISDYPLQVSTRFRPICPVPPDGSFTAILNAGIIPQATCAQAAEIEVEITVDPRAGGNFPIPSFKTSVFVENAYITGA